MGTRPDPVTPSFGRVAVRSDFWTIGHATRALDEVLSPTQSRRIREYFDALLPGSSEYYFFEDQFGDLPYDPEEPVFLLAESGKRVELSARSEIIRGIMKKLVHARYYVPHEHAGAVAKLIA